MKQHNHIFINKSKSRLWFKMAELGAKDGALISGNIIHIAIVADDKATADKAWNDCYYELRQRGVLAEGYDFLL